MRGLATYMAPPPDGVGEPVSPREVSNVLLPWARGIVADALGGARPDNSEPSASVVNLCFAEAGFAPGLVLGLSKMLPTYQNPFPPCRIIEVHPHGFVIRTEPPAPECDADPVRQPVQHFIAYRDLYLPPNTGVSILWPQALRFRVATLRFALHEIAPKQGKWFTAPWVGAEAPARGGREAQGDAGREDGEPAPDRYGDSGKPTTVPPWQGAEAATNAASAQRRGGARPAALAMV